MSATVAATLLSEALWRATWQGSAAVLCAWCVCRCWIWRLALLKFPVALFLPALFAVALLPPPAAAPPPASAAAAATLVSISDGIQPIRPDIGFAPPLALAAIKQQLALAPRDVPATLPPLAAAIGAEPPMSRSIAPALRRVLPDLAVGLWLLGVLIAGARVAKAGFRTGRWRRLSCPPVEDTDLHFLTATLCARLDIARAPDLCTAADLPLPLLTGLRRPAIILPARDRLDEFGPASLRLMLAHELAHLRRADLAWSWLSTVTRTLFCFLPPVWFAAREEAVAREAACDALAVHACEAHPAEFGRLLVQIAARRSDANRGSAAPALGVGGTTAEIKRRLIALRDQATISPTRLRLLGAALALGAFCVLLPWRVAAQTAAVPSPGSTAAVGVRPSVFTLSAFLSKYRVITIMRDGEINVNREWIPLQDLAAHLKRPGMTPQTTVIVNAEPDVDPALVAAAVAEARKAGATKFGDRSPFYPLRYGTIVGRVTDGSGRPLTNVIIRPGAGRIVAATDPEGNYFLHIGPGTVRLAVTAVRDDSYDAILDAALQNNPSARSTVTVAAHAVAHVDFHVTGIVLPAPVEGRVLGPYGQPARGAEVVLGGYSGYPQLNVRTDTLGRFWIPQLPMAYLNKTCVLRARGEGMVSRPVRIFATPEGAQPCLLRLEPGLAASVSGRVIDAATGRPIAGAAVTVGEARGETWVNDTVVTDAGGNYHVGMLWPDMGHGVWTHPKGYGHRALGSPQLHAGERRAGFDFRLPVAKLAIAGVVVTPADHPVAQAEVSAVDVDAGTMTDSQGRFRIAGLLPGSLEIHIVPLPRVGTGAASLQVQATAGNEAMRIVVP